MLVQKVYIISVYAFFVVSVIICQVFDIILGERIIDEKIKKIPSIVSFVIGVVCFIAAMIGYVVLDR